MVMAATPQQVLDMLLTGVDTALPMIFNQVNAYEDNFTVSEAFGGCCDDLVGAGRIQWRHKLGDPVPTFRRALDLASQAVDLLKGLKKADYAKQHVKFGSLAMVSFLIDDNLKQAFINLLPPFSSWTKNKQSIVYTYPDVGIVHALQTGEKPPQWDKLLKAILDLEEGFELFCETYSCYMDIIAHARDRDTKTLRDLILKASEVYDRRRNDKHCRSFATIEGCGAMADHMADHRLGAIIKYCSKYSPQLTKNLRIVHVWRHR
jgi:hypothetical protein